jgi:hypothetical protein
MARTFCATAFTLTRTSFALGAGVGNCLIETSWATLNLVAAFHTNPAIPRSFVANARIVVGAMICIWVAILPRIIWRSGMLLSVAMLTHHEA